MKNKITLMIGIGIFIISIILAVSLVFFRNILFDYPEIPLVAFPLFLISSIMIMIGGLKEGT